MNYIWLFHTPNNSKFCGGVFTLFSNAKIWIEKHKLTGVLTKYPIDVGVYDWAINEKVFSVKKDKHSSPEFIGGFTTASQEHFHFEDGFLCD